MRHQKNTPAVISSGLARKKFNENLMRLQQIEERFVPVKVLTTKQDGV